MLGLLAHRGVAPARPARRRDCDTDVASQGATVEEARANLREAIELFFETADLSEVERRLHSEVYVTRLDVVRG